MIGGTMLMCAVGAMILIAMWSLKGDEYPDAVPRDGLLALREFDGPSKRRGIQPTTSRRHASRRPAVAPPKPKQLEFDAKEMAAIEAEAKATLPDFVHRSREEY